MLKNNCSVSTKSHIGSIFIALGTILLFAGGGENLQISGNHYFFIIAIFFNMFDFITREKKIKINYLFLASLYMIFATCSFFLLDMANSGEGLSLLVIYLLLISVLLCEYNSADINVIVSGMITSGLILSLLLLLFGKGYSGAIYDKYTYTQSFGNHLEFEPNFLALTLITACELSIWKVIVLIRNNKFIQGGIYIFTSLIILIASIRTGSRAILLSLAIYIIVLVMFSKNKKIKKYALYMILLGMLLFVISLDLGIIPSRIYDRFFDFNAYLDESNLHRLNNWYIGIKAMLSKFFGYGAIDSSLILSQYYNYFSAAHNTFIAMGISFGIFGVIIFIGIFLQMLVSLWKDNDKILFSFLFSMLVLWNILECQYTVAIINVMIICSVSSENRNLY